MQVSIWWPTFTAELDAGGVTFSDSATGFRFRVNGTGLVDADGVAPYCSKTLAQPSALQPVAAALDYERRYVRKTGALTLLGGSPDVVPTGSSSDWHDDSSPHETGGARRMFISAGFSRHLRGAEDGMASMKSWAKDQERLPVGHLLAQPFSYDDYKGRAADGWLYDQRDAAGHGIFDPAHLECSILYEGAIAGDAECMAHLVTLGCWLANTFPGTGPHGNRLGWTGSSQDRARGEVLGCYARLALAGVGVGTACAEFRDRFLAGFDPKQHLVGLLKVLAADPPGLGSGTVTGTLPDIGTYNGRREIQADYGWQAGIEEWWIAYALASGVVGATLRDQTLAWLAPRTADRMRRTVTAAGVARAFSKHDDFSQHEVELANAAAGKQAYELADDGDGLGTIREFPYASDSEVSAAGLYLLGHPQKATALLKLRPDPDQDPGNYRKHATYLEPVYALLGR